MIKIYKNLDKNKIVFRNDLYFALYTSRKINSDAVSMVKDIDGVDMLDSFHFKSKFNHALCSIESLSTGCKTALNIYYNPDKIFTLDECGLNAISVIFRFDEGMCYSKEIRIPEDFKSIEAYTDHGDIIINSDVELRRWWDNEM